MDQPYDIQEIDADLLDAAMQRLASYTPLGDTRPRWSVSRLERERSVVFRLVAEDPKNSPTIYYKVHRSTPGKTSSQAMEAISRYKRLTDRLLELARGTGIVAPPVLAVDPSRLTIVTLGLAGQPLRMVRLPRLTSSKREAETRHFELIGRAMRLIEMSSLSESVVFDAESFKNKVDRKLNRSFGSDSELARRVRSWLDELLERASAEGSPVYSHGDLSPTNILVSKQEVGLIDFRWTARFQTFDLAVLSYRLRRISPLWPQWRKKVSQALVDGYIKEAGAGTPVDAWHLTNAQMLIRALTSQTASARSEARDALTAIAGSGGLKAPRSHARPSWWWDEASRRR